MKAQTKARTRTPRAPRLTLTLTRGEWGTLQDALQDGMPPGDTAAARYQALERTLYALTGDRRTTPVGSTPGAVRAMTHTPLTLDDRDALNRLRARIEQHALLVQHTLSTKESDEADGLSERDEAILDVALIELCASIVTDAAALGDRLDVAARRTGGAR